MKFKSLLISRKTSLNPDDATSRLKFKHDYIVSQYLAIQFVWPNIYIKGKQSSLSIMSYMINKVIWSNHRFWHLPVVVNHLNNHQLSKKKCLLFFYRCVDFASSKRRPYFCFFQFTSYIDLIWFISECKMNILCCKCLFNRQINSIQNFKHLSSAINYGSKEVLFYLINSRKKIIQWDSF